MHQLHREQPLVTGIRIVGYRSEAAVAITFSGHTGVDVVAYEFGSNPHVSRTRARDLGARGVCGFEIVPVPGQSLDDLALRLFSIWDSYNNRGVALSREQTGQLTPDQSVMLAADFAAAGRTDVALRLSGETILQVSSGKAAGGVRELSQDEANAYLAELIRVQRPAAPVRRPAQFAQSAHSARRRSPYPRRQVISAQR